MTKDAAQGRPLLRAAEELLSAGTRILVTMFKSVAGIPKEVQTASHYQRAVWRAMRPHLQDGQWSAIGFPDGAEEPKAIHPQFFDSAEPDLLQSTVTSHGVTYSAVRVFEASTAPRGIVTEIPAAPGAKAGPDPRHGDEFIQEMLRFAMMEDCPTRKVLSDHMKSWCADTLGDQAPVDRTVERWVQRYWPPAVPTK